MLSLLAVLLLATVHAFGPQLTAVLSGWTTGYLTDIHEASIAIIFGFIAGATVLNILKEELPEYRKSNYLAFFIGVSLYTLALLLAG